MIECEKEGCGKQIPVEKVINLQFVDERTIYLCEKHYRELLRFIARWFKGEIL